jgi:hypothetical protein
VLWWVFSGIDVAISFYTGSQPSTENAKALALSLLTFFSWDIESVTLAAGLFVQARPELSPTVGSMVCRARSGAINIFEKLHASMS